MKITLIDDIKNAWRFAVMWVQAFGASLIGAWLLLPEEQRQAVLAEFGITPERLMAYTALSVIAATAFARVVKQDLPKVEQ